MNIKGIGQNFYRWEYNMYPGLFIQLLLNEDLTANKPGL